MKLADIALASSTAALKSFIELPLRRIHQRQKIEKSPHRRNPGTIEQAIIDTLGRCVNGLDKCPELREKMKALIGPEFFDGINSAVANLQYF